MNLISFITICFVFIIVVDAQAPNSSTLVPPSPWNNTLNGSPSRRCIVGTSYGGCAMDMPCTPMKFQGTVDFQCNRNNSLDTSDYVCLFSNTVRGTDGYDTYAGSCVLRSDVRCMYACGDPTAVQISYRISTPHDYSGRYSGMTEPEMNWNNTYCMPARDPKCDRRNWDVCCDQDNCNWLTRGGPLNSATTTTTTLLHTYTYIISILVTVLIMIRSSLV